VRIVRATGAEFAKLFSVRLWWILAIVMVVYVGLAAGGVAAVFGGLGSEFDETGPAIDLARAHLLVYSTASAIGYVFPVLLGALATTSEFRHQTLAPTFLAEPRRGAVLAGKLVAMAVVGALFGVLALAAAISAGAVVLGVTGGEPRLDDGATWVLAARVVLAMALWALIGVALGTVIPSQVAVLVIVLAFTQFVEPLLRSVAFFAEWTGRLAQFLPGAASDALVGSSVFTTLGGAGVVQLEWWQGGLVLAGIALVATVVGWFATWRRDVG
jgi:ABC-2 type transport system permease protein